MGAVRINNDLQVEVTESCFAIQKRFLTKKEVDGVEVVTEKWVGETYHNTWEGVFHTLIKKFIALKMENKVIELDELGELYSEVRREVKELLKPLSENK